MYRDTAKQILEDIEDLIEDLLADGEIEFDLSADVVRALDEGHDSVEEAYKRLKT